MIFEGKVGIGRYISEIFAQNSPISAHILGQLVPELETLVKFDLQLDLGSKDSSREEVTKVFLQVQGIDSLDLSIGSLGNRADRINIALSADDGDNVDSHALWFCILSTFFVEFGFVSEWCISEKIFGWA